jgi:hypothetical protein
MSQFSSSRSDPILLRLASPSRVVVSAHEVAELLRLYAELPVASMRAAEALRKSGGMPLKGIALQRFLDEEAKRKSQRSSSE